MKWVKKSVMHLNDLLKNVKEQRDKVVSVIESLCPNKFEECDAQLSINKNCPYFTLCNVMGSYGLISEDEQKEADEFLKSVYDKVECKKRGAGIYF